MENSSFVQVMKDWRRMCKAQDDGSDRDVCETCQMGSGGCSAIYEDDGSMDYAHVEKVVTKWAAEHPVVYPTWLEYLMNAFPDCGKAYMGGNDLLWKWMWNTPIPADMAEKLGVEPKEGA